MLQVTQYQKTGEMFVEELPEPTLREGGVLVRNLYSLVSAGTERSSVETAQASLIGKAKKRPDLVKQVLDNAKREGLQATYEKVKTRLDNYAQLGYSSAGIVIESSVPDLKPGDRVACAGAGYASHAEVVFVPKNLAAKIPENVDFENAAFTTLGSIALQGVRQADVRVGENVAVIGLGLLGLISVQLLKASGCRVIGLDVTKDYFDLAGELGCDECVLSSSEALPAVESFTRGYGTDAVIITAATNSSEPVELAIEMARKKSTIVVVGAVGMNIPRNPFYQKELDFRISCSYGPGRYDGDYEERGIDYPVGHVRWTENRNMQAILDLVSTGNLDVKSLTTHTFPIGAALGAYDLITGKIKQAYLGILISYPTTGKKTAKVAVGSKKASSGMPTIGFIGAGNFAQSYLLPPLQKSGVVLKGVMTTSPVKAKSAARKFGFEFCTGEASTVLSDADAIFVATRHDSHAPYVLDALKAGKHVFVEKPLAVNLDELDTIKLEYVKSNDKALMVGFNRRFSAPFQDIRSFFSDVSEPLLITYRINAGFIPKDHWTQSPEQGGRIIGEGCHFIDCMSFLTNSLPSSVYAESISTNNSQVTDADNASIIIKYSDGSIGTLIYVANGDKGPGKEYCEISGGGRTAIMDNFSTVTYHKNGGQRKQKYDGSKGHRQEVAAFLGAIQGKDKVIAFDSLYMTTLSTIMAMESLNTKCPYDLNEIKD
jgi:predicted dehydrogenase/threonine dehydrogenase-like Zn-dependent dehydrogenase